MITVVHVLVLAKRPAGAQTRSKTVTGKKAGSPTRVNALRLCSPGTGKRSSIKVTCSPKAKQTPRYYCSRRVYSFVQLSPQALEFLKETFSQSGRRIQQDETELDVTENCAGVLVLFFLFVKKDTALVIYHGVYYSTAGHCVCCGMPLGRFSRYEWRYYRLKTSFSRCGVAFH